MPIMYGWDIKYTFSNIAALYIIPQCRDYAELVQSRIKRLQVTVGIIYLNTEMNLSTALDDVSRRGVLYAIVLTAQHEVHRSVTVNILHGTPQGEYRCVAMS